jgi:hypothetical protein
VRYESFSSFKSFGPPEQAYAMRESLLANANALAVVASSNLYDPVVRARYAGVMQVIRGTRSLPLLRLMDVAVVASPSLFGLPQIASTSRGAIRFYQVPGTPRRVWQFENARTVPDADAALAALADAAFDPTAAVILEADDKTKAASAMGALSPAAVEINVVFEKPGWLLLADTYYPGWVAAVDGVPTAILHGDYAFRAVGVAAGAHSVVFDYQPGSLRLGLWLTGLGMLLTVLLGLAAYRWPRPAQ